VVKLTYGGAPFLITFVEVRSMSDLPSLQILPIAHLLIHEHHDHQRTLPLAHRLKANGTLRNPPIVSPLQDGSDRYMVLDGANRVTALGSLGYPHLLAQVVEPNDPGLNLQTWNHIVWELEAERFLAGLQRIPGLELTTCLPQDGPPALEGDCGLVHIHTGEGCVYAACSTSADLETRVGLLNALVDSYKTRARLDRTNQTEVETLRAIYPLLSGIVVFPPFAIDALLRLAGAGLLLPPGITRFVIAPRALHVNYPLAEFAAGDSLATKNARLHTWLQDRLARKGVRYYAEPTVLFDE
jgi:hypothetical protein